MPRGHSCPRKAGYNPTFWEDNIGAILHPVRGTLIIAAGVPVLLVLTIIFTKLTGNNTFADAVTKGIRYVLAVELVGFLIAASLGFVYEQGAEKRDHELYPPPGRLVDIGGYRLHLHCSGTGPTVVLEYGQQGSYVDWHRVQPQLADFARVCIYDRGGYGWSDANPKSRVPSVIAGELHSLLHSAGEKPPYILVGHSFGGLSALMFAHKFPDEVEGVVLVDASMPEMMSRLGWRDGIRLRVMQGAIPFGLPRWRGWCGGNAPAAIRGLKQAITCRSSLYAAYYREWVSFPESAAEVRAITSIGSIPLVVIARDPAIAARSEHETKWNEQQHARTKLSSKSEFMVATGSGHDVPLDRPDVITAAVRKLIAAQASHFASRD